MEMSTTTTDVLALMYARMPSDEQRHFIDGFHMYLAHDTDRDFVISLDDVFQWIGFTRKDNAKACLSRNLMEDQHYQVSLRSQENPLGGRPSEVILMTVRGFKHLCMAAGTAKGMRIRDYYIDMELIMFEITKRRLEAQNNALVQQLEAVRMEAGDRSRHDTLIGAYLNRPVVYLARAKVMEDGSWLLKIGETNDLKQRASDHRSEFGTSFTVMDVIDCVHAHRLEQDSFRLTELQGRRYTRPVGKSQREQREVFVVETPAHYKRIVVAMQKLRDDIERADTARVQVMALGLEAARIEVERDRIEAEREQTRIEAERDVEVKRLELAAAVASLAMQDQNIHDNQDPVHAPPPAPSVLRNPDRHYTQARGTKMQRYSPDGITLLATYTGVTEATRDPIFNHSCTLHLIKHAARTATLYKGFRWAALDRTLPDETVQTLPSTQDTRTQTRGYIAALNLDKTRIERVFCDMKQAGEERQVCISAISTAVKRGNRCSGHYFMAWDDCDEALQQDYLARTTLPEKRVHVNGQVILQIDPVTEEVVRRFSSVQDVIKHVSANRATLKKALDDGAVFRGYRWTRCISTLD